MKIYYCLLDSYDELTIEEYSLERDVPKSYSYSELSCVGGVSNKSAEHARSLVVRRIQEEIDHFNRLGDFMKGQV